MFRPLSAACQDDASFVRYPVFRECERNSLKLWLCMCVRVCSSEWKPWVGLMLSGCFVRCQQPVKMMRLSLGTPCFVSVNVTAWNCDCVCVCVCSSEWKPWVGLVLSGCFVRCQQPVKMMHLSSGTPCFVSVSVTAWNCDVYVCACVRVCSSEWKPWVGLVLSGCFVRCQQPVKMMRLSSGTLCFVSVSVTAWNCDCVCVCVCAVVSESLEWVLCCLDVASVVSSLSRCLVFRQVPRVLWVWA